MIVVSIFEDAIIVAKYDFRGNIRAYLKITANGSISGHGGIVEFLQKFASMAYDRYNGEKGCYAFHLGKWEKVA